jgi:hydroxysqualene synthase
MSSGDHLGVQLRTAYAACERLARQHYENFPVASLLLPKAMRPHVAAVYAFARVADDFADEDDRPPGERQHLLDDWLERLHRAVGIHAGTRTARREGAGRDVSTVAAADTHDLMFTALANTIRECRLPVGLFEDLLDAFRQDTVKTRYETFDELLDYARRSANPVGRLLLRIAGHHEGGALDVASDRVCTALQLTNFWQDLGRDWASGRLYVPLVEMKAEGAREQDLDDGKMTAAWQRVMLSLVRRTRSLFIDGRGVAQLTRGRLALELRLTWLGGMRILERVERQRYDVLTHRPTLGKTDLPVLLWRAARWSSSR